MSFGRTRTKDERRLRPAQCTNIWKNQTPVIYPWNGTMVGRVSMMSDTKTPRYSHLRALGMIINNSMQLVRTELSSTDQDLMVGRPNVDDLAFRFTGCCGGFIRTGAKVPPPPVIDGAAMYQLALAGAYAKANASPIMAGEIMRDLDATIGMLRRPFSKATDILNKMRKYRKLHAGKTAKSLEKATSNAWLEERYGWAPLIMDGNAIIKESALAFERSEKRRLVSRSSQVMSKESSCDYTNNIEPTMGFRFSGHTSVKCEMRVHAGVIRSIEAAGTGEKASAILGLGTRDLLPTLWETIPYSFVLDWFVNVGSYLQAVSPALGTQFLAAWVTTVYITTTQRTGNWGWNRSGLLTAWYDGPFGDVSDVVTVVNRDAQPTLTHPVLTQGSLGVLHSVDGLALVCGKIIRGLGEFH